MTMQKKYLLAVLLVLCLLLSACRTSRHKPGNDAPERIEQAIDENGILPHRITGCSAEEYTMDITLHPQERIVDGTSVVELTNTTQKALNEVCFRLYSANISAGTVNSASNADTGTEYELEIGRDPSVIYVALGDDAIQPQETLSVKLVFQSQIPEINDRLGYYQEAKGMLFNMTFCFPQLAFYENGKWFEEQYISTGESYCYEMSDYHVALTAPADYVVVSSGKSETVDGKTVIEAPNVREMAICASNFAQIRTLESNGVALRILAMEYAGINEQYLSDFYDTLLAVAAESVEFYSEKVGDYIYDELDIVPMMLSDIGGMEFPGLIQVCFPDDPNSDVSNMRMADFPGIVTAHEVGHQWFYCAVSNDTSQEPWLDESLVSYLEYLYCDAYVTGKEAVEAFNAKYAPGCDSDYYISAFTYNDENDCKDYINLPVYEYKVKNYSAIVYDQGAWFFRELELAMGSDRFFEMLSQWYEENLYQVVTGEALIAHILECDDSDPVKEVINEYISEEYL